MKPILLFIFLSVLLIFSAWSANFSCRDSNGRLYFFDNPMDVPADCRQNMQQIEGGNSSATEVPPQGQENTTTSQEAQAPQESQPSSKPPVEQTVQDDALKQQLEQLQQRATAAVDKFTKGTELKEKGSRPYHYGAKTERAEGNKLIQEARQEKQQLITELNSLALTAGQQSEFKNILDKIQ